MSIIHRLWPRETPTPEVNPPLDQRLKDLVGKDAPSVPEGDTGKPGGPAPAHESAPQAEQPTTDSTFQKPSFRPTPWERERQEKPMENRGPETLETKITPQEPPPERHTPSPASKGPGRQFMERVQGAVGRTQPADEKSPEAVGHTTSEFPTIQKQFEADFRKRLDGALAEFERRVSSQALVDDVAGQIEQRIRLVADGIFREAKNQAWTMHSAVADELRSFRDQFGKEIEERVGMLDRAAQNALQWKEKLEQAIPKAEDALRALPASGQEAMARIQAAAKGMEDELRHFHEEASRDLGLQRENLQSQARNFRQDSLQLSEQMEKFRSEAGAACDLLGQTTDQSLEKLHAAVEEAGSHAKDEMEKLATEIERRILSGGLVERATEQLGKATQDMVEPALDRIRKAGDEAHASAESLASEGQRVAEQFETVRQQIEARLDSLLGEQLTLLDGAMSGFQRKASKELGSIVERVVAQSTSQLDDRLHGLLQDLFANTSKQINTVARATLNNMHEGLKEAFRTDSSSPADDPAPASDNE